MENVFTTEQDAVDAQVADLQMHLDHHKQIDFNQDWEDQTDRWDTVQKREDANEWFYEVCPDGIQTHTQKEAQGSWYPVIEE
ncbi:MAG: hypothetical protein BBJ57_02085 [Desulfobacterales bacterium PC51MH44]|nr:MAG: hypothetical protein BBJ57_02085 [Desulfobacterales bacterium PC51MH44]